MAASRPSAKNTSFTPASPAGSFAAILSIRERRSESAGGARTRLALGPPKRCDEKLSRKLEVRIYIYIYVLGEGALSCPPRAQVVEILSQSSLDH